MAGVARKKTPLETAGINAREALTKAREAHDKNANATTKKALDDAKEKASAATKAENRERFETIGAGRVGSAIAKMKALAKAANKRSYEFNAADIKKMQDVLTAELNSTIETFNNNLNAGPKAATVTNAFKF